MLKLYKTRRNDYIFISFVFFSFFSSFFFLLFLLFYLISSSMSGATIDVEYIQLISFSFFFIWSLEIHGVPSVTFLKHKNDGKWQKIAYYGLVVFSRHTIFFSFCPRNIDRHSKLFPNIVPFLIFVKLLIPHIKNYKIHHWCTLCASQIPQNCSS